MDLRPAAALLLAAALTSCSNTTPPCAATGPEGAAITVAVDREDLGPTAGAPAPIELEACNADGCARTTITGPDGELQIPVGVETLEEAEDRTITITYTATHPSGARFGDGEATVQAALDGEGDCPQGLRVQKITLTGDGTRIE